MTPKPNAPYRVLRELTPRDVPLLEPDLLGAVSMLLHGRASPPAEEESAPVPERGPRTLES